MVYEKLKNIYEEHFYIRIFTNILLNSFLVGRINNFSFEQIKNENPLLFPPRRYYQQILLPHEQNNRGLHTVPQLLVLVLVAVYK